uniref:Secreted protein n=1 Tax=Aegilops tauschii subsp. strangulata TaxID=200361 RepID=A0A453Q7T8_AEGTS
MVALANLTLILASWSCLCIISVCVPLAVDSPFVFVYRKGKLVSDRCKNVNLLENVIPGCFHTHGRSGVPS